MKHLAMAVVSPRSHIGDDEAHTTEASGPLSSLEYSGEKLSVCPSPTHDPEDLVRLRWHARP